MPTTVVMPQMGESIAEGTIVRWIKKVGEAVERDEPLFEISTDKVDAEVPSPVAGILTEIKVHEGETVSVNSAVATIGTPSDVEAAPEAELTSSAPAASTTAPPAAMPAGAAGAPPRQQARRDGGRGADSPLVRRLAREHGLDLSQIVGSGAEGRVTRDDVLRHIEASRPSSPVSLAGTPESRSGDRVDIKAMSVMRRKIAEHMVLSRRTAAHVHSVFHVDFSAVERVRQAGQAEQERLGVKLTYTAIVAAAVAEVIQRHPVINASIEGTNIVYKKDINLGIAVALDDGLIVPVVKNADRKTLRDLGVAIADLAGRARSKQLRPDEVQDGTFTITNPGHYGAQFGMPIINQPQVAILGMGAVEKRPVVVDGAITIRTMAYLTLGFDHRLVDGAAADHFMSDLKQRLERFESHRP